MHNKRVQRTLHKVSGPLTRDVETEPLRGEETEPREVFLLLV